MKIAGNAFLVTGGSSGLGAACTKMFVDAGGSVLVADLNPPADGIPDAVRYVKADVTSESDLRQAVQTAVEVFGGLRGVVTCAGIEWAERTLGKNGPHGLEGFVRTLQVNLVGSFNAVRLAAEAMSRMPPAEDGERGVAVMTASVAAFDGQIGQAAYSASKGGIVSMTLPLARDLARSGVRVASIAPGIFDTPLLARLGDAVRESLAAQIPFPSRLGRPEEFAQLVGHIVGNRMINGEVVRLDGALRMAGK